jgi:hypothetical protein
MKINEYVQSKYRSKYVIKFMAHIKIGKTNFSTRQYTINVLVYIVTRSCLFIEGSLWVRANSSEIAFPDAS